MNIDDMVRICVDGDVVTAGMAEYLQRNLVVFFEEVQAENGRLRERVEQLVKDVDAAIAGHLDYSYCAECDEMRYFEVRVADGVFDGDTAFRCRVCGQADEGGE